MMDIKKPKNKKIQFLQRDGDALIKVLIFFILTKKSIVNYLINFYNFENLE